MGSAGSHEDHGKDHGGPGRVKVVRGIREIGIQDSTAKTVDFINVHTNHFTSRIELMSGKVDNLSKRDECDLLVVYLRARGDHKANRDSALAALNRAGISLEELEKTSVSNPSYRRHYNCWVSDILPANKPKGFEYKRLLVYEDPGGELETDDNIILDIMQCLATVVGGELKINSVMLPLLGGLLSHSLRKHFVRAAVQVTYAWVMVGLPLRRIRILLPEADIAKDLEVFAQVKEKLKVKDLPKDKAYDVYFSYAREDAVEVKDMIDRIQTKRPGMKIYDGVPSGTRMRDRGIVSEKTISAITQSCVVIAILSDDYFHSPECTEAFSLAYCSDFDNQGNMIIPLFWRSCDLTPLARRLLATQGVDCREQDSTLAYQFLDTKLGEAPILAETIVSSEQERPQGNREFLPQGNLIGDKILMDKENQDKNLIFGEIIEEKQTAQPAVENLGKNIFDDNWRKTWSMEFKDIIFGPKIGAGGFGEVFKAKYDSEVVAVKTLTTRGHEDKIGGLMKEFLLEIKLMSSLTHPNIVTFLGACVQSPTMAIVLEFMPGGSLFRILYKQMKAHNAPLSTVKQVYIALNIAKGMEYLHAQNPVVVHRDLKSPNVLLGRTVEEVKVTDFGLSRVKEQTYVDTGPGGTPEWMAPEMLRQDVFDESVDIWAFGVILWELMVCEKPFKDDHPMQVVFKVGSKGDRLRLPSKVEASQEMKTMMEKCFNADPKARPRFSEIVPELAKLRERYMPTPKPT